MNFLKTLVKYLVTVLRILLYEWVLSLLRLCRTLLSICKHWCKRRKLPRWEKKTAKTRCVSIREPAFKRPDPLIYSQAYLMKLGFAVTWDNPDIQLHQNGVPVSSSLLEKDTEYEIEARIWNNSTEAPVIGLPVKFSYLSFGVGTQSHAIGDTTADLGVKGGPNHPAFACIKWRTPVEAGHYCIQVLLDWMDDVNPYNNLGQENTDVGMSHSPADFTFTLRNDTRETQTYRFEVDTYQIPKLLPCDKREIKVEGQRRFNRLVGEQVEAVPDQHDRSNYPVPVGWSVEIDPVAPKLEPNQEQVIEAKITPPDDFKGRQLFNINANNRYGLAGGVSLYVVGQ